MANDGTKSGGGLSLARGFFWCVIVLAGGSVLAMGLKVLERRTLRNQPVSQGPVAFRIALLAPPSWMPLSLGQRIVGSLFPPRPDYYDPQLTQKVHALAQREPWIRKVSGVGKRLAGDGKTAVIEVRADFRQPVARVASERNGTHFVDAEGFVLSAEEIPRWLASRTVPPGQPPKWVCYTDLLEIPRGQEASKIHYITLEGVAAPPPPPGKPWEGGDVADGIRLARLLLTRLYANQIVTVDVSNYDGRRNPQKPEIVLYAQKADGPRTEIRFGRFARPTGDIVIPTEQKMAYLDYYAGQNEGRICGLHAYIDLRYDELRYSRQ